MRRLFIIGNGFDTAHCLPTKYQDYHKYLRRKYPNANEISSVPPTSAMGHHGEVIYAPDEVVGYLMNLISRTEGDNWSDVEATMGNLDFDEDFDVLPEETDRDGDRNLWHESYNNEDLARELAGCVPMISSLFSDWVDTIDISDANAHKDKVFADIADFACDLFLNFNYTFTLERVYGAKKVCHIHGCQGSNELLFGHGAGHRFDEDHFSPYTGCEDGLEAIQDALRKDTAGAIKANSGFFNSISSEIREIYSYGLSFGTVDLVYIQEICRHLDTRSVTWFLHNYDAEKHEDQMTLIVGSGFHGRFKTFG